LITAALPKKACHRLITRNRHLQLVIKTTISLLHEIIQVAMGWDSCHLHQLVIRGKEYGVSYEGGVHFADNLDKIRLAEFRFRLAERFEYQYDFGDNWEHTMGYFRKTAADFAKRSAVQQWSLYPALHRLERGGWLSSSCQVTEHNRRAKYYRLTRKGVKRFESETEFRTAY
jgi:hypothetical protein